MENLKAIIYCFSGTGNTYIAAQKVAEALSAYNIDADIFRVRIPKNTDDDSFIESEISCKAGQKKSVKISKYNFRNIPDPNNYDISLFAYPVYGFNTPWFFMKFIKCLPELKENKRNMRAFIFKTSGEPFPLNNTSSYVLVKALRKKGFRPCSDMHMLMPYNIIFRFPDAMVKQMYFHTESMAKKLAGDVASQNYKVLKYNPFGVVFSKILRLQQFGAWINGPLHSVNAKTCISCGKCIELCPSSNIKFVSKSYKDENGKITEKQIPRMGSNCQMCMACTFNCPKASINPGFLTPLKVNPGYDFNKIIKDESVPSNWTDSPNAKFFKLFRKYYKKNPLI